MYVAAAIGTQSRRVDTHSDGYKSYTDLSIYLYRTVSSTGQLLNPVLRTAESHNSAHVSKTRYCNGEQIDSSDHWRYSSLLQTQSTSKTYLTNL